MPRQLPADIAGFTGRESQLAELDALLASTAGTPTVVISAVSGTAGVGKTALAVCWAHRVADRFPDGQLYVNLRGFDRTDSVLDPADAVRRFLAALDVPAGRIPADPEAQAALYRSRLAGKRMLVVLDNARDSAQVRPLLPASPHCLVLVTSRRQLTGLVTDGAHPVNLDLFTVDEARELLDRRLGSDRVAAEPAAVEEIISRFSWSYRTLTPAAARLFRLLGLHPGPDVSAPGVTSLSAFPVAEVRSSLAELVQANLVVEHVAGRYTSHDLLRAYASEQAARIDTESQRHAATHRMLDHYLHTAYAAALLLNPTRDPIGVAPPQPGVTPEHLGDRQRALDWFTAEHPVLLAALDLATAAGYDTGVWQLAWALADFLDRRALWHDRVTAGLAAVAAAGRLADPAVQARTHQFLANSYGGVGRYTEAHAHMQHALDLYGRCGDHTGQAHTHHNLAQLWGQQGRHAEALEQAEQALAMHRAAGHRVGLATTLNTVGWYHALLGDYQRAFAACEQANCLFQELNDPPGEAATWDSLGCARHHLGDHERAIADYRSALRLYRDVGDRLQEAATLTNLGDTYHTAGGSDAAREAWEEALGILDELDPSRVEHVRTRLATL